MAGSVRLRKGGAWEFFDEQPKSTGGGVRPPGKVEDLPLNLPKAVAFFVRALGGRHKVMDLGCGVGFPAPYLAPRVAEIVGGEPAPRMVAEAREPRQAGGGERKTRRSQCRRNALCR